MSALIGHAKAARILGEEFAAVSRDTSAISVAHLLMAMADTYSRAADRMEQAMREEATGREDAP